MITYIIGILSALFIGTISVKWAEVPRLYDYINFALTMSSLILAVLAIIYALQTGGSLFASLNKIEDASSSINQTSIKIEESNRALREKVESLPSAIHSVKETVDGYSDFFKKLSGSFDKKDIENKEHNVLLPTETLVQIVRNLAKVTKNQLAFIKTMNDANLALDIDSFGADKSMNFFYGYFLSIIDIASKINLIEVDVIERNGIANLFKITIPNEEIINELKDAVLDDNEKFVLKSIMTKHTVKIEDTQSESAN